MRFCPGEPRKVRFHEREAGSNSCDSSIRSCLRLALPLGLPALVEAGRDVARKVDGLPERPSHGLVKHEQGRIAIAQVAKQSEALSVGLEIGKGEDAGEKAPEDALLFLMHQNLRQLVSLPAVWRMR